MFYPLTPGLLISMSLRNDHSFGCDAMEEIAALGWTEVLAEKGIEMPGTLSDKQCELIGISYNEYVDYVDGKEIQPQRKEEIEGQGFYAPEREQMYTAMATPQALLLAQTLCE